MFAGWSSTARARGFNPSQEGLPSAMRWALSNPVWTLSSHKSLATASGSSQWQQQMRRHNVRNYSLRFFSLDLMGAKIESFLYLHTLREQLYVEKRCLQQGSALWTGSARTNLKPVMSGGCNSWMGKGKWGRNAQGKARLWCSLTFISTGSTFCWGYSRPHGVQGSAGQGWAASTARLWECATHLTGIRA